MLGRTDYPVTVVVGRMQSRFLERIPEFVFEDAFDVDDAVRRVVGETIGSLVPPEDVGRKPTIFGRTGLVVEGEAPVPYSAMARMAPLPKSKIVPDATVELVDGTLVVVPVGMRGAGSSWKSFYVLYFIERVIGLHRRERMLEDEKGEESSTDDPMDATAL